MRAPALTFKRARRLRREMSLPEVILWRDIRRGSLDGLQFRRQHPIGPYILDFYCSSARLCVEIDGGGHDEPDQAAHDARRDAWLKDHDIKVMRVMAVDILKDIEREHVLKAIAHAAAPSTAFGGPPPPLRG